jgi:hypothetical protein
MKYLFIIGFLARCALTGAAARRCSSAKRRDAFTSLADSDPGHLEARASRVHHDHWQHNKLSVLQVLGRARPAGPAPRCPGPRPAVADQAAESRVSRPREAGRVARLPPTARAPVPRPTHSVREMPDRLEATAGLPPRLPGTVTPAARVWLPSPSPGSRLRAGSRVAQGAEGVAPGSPTGSSVGLPSRQWDSSVEAAGPWVELCCQAGGQSAYSSI